MRQIIFLLILLLVRANCFSQTNFTLNSTVGSTNIKINGTPYEIGSSTTKIKTNHPEFDTLIFLGETPNANIEIICNFKPDSNYSITVACCASFDIIPASRFINDSLKIWNYETDFGKIQNQLVDRPYISIRTLNDPKDSIFAWHADAACITKHSLIDSNLWHLGVPPKCFYWNNITCIQFFKTDSTILNHRESDLEEFLNIDNIVELTNISFRLFDDERFVIIYDEKRNKVTLQYE